MSTDTNTTKAAKNYERYVYARDNGHLVFLDKDEKCNKFFEGLQWEERVRKQLEMQGRPVMTINKTLSTISTVMGEQLKNRSDVTFKPFRNGNSDTATALAKTYLQIQNANGYHWKESEMFDDGIIGSRGFLDIRMDFDDQMQGEVKIDLANRRNVVIDPDADQYDPDTWREVFVTRWMSDDEIEAEYGEKAAKKLRGKTKSSFTFGYDSIDSVDETFGGERTGRAGDVPKDKALVRIIERQYRKYITTEHFVDTESGDTRVVPNNWDEERIEKVKKLYGWEVIRKRGDVIFWTVSADDILLHDEQSPYKHFTIVPFFPYFRHGRTIGLVENLVSPQEILNKVLSQELHVLNSSANGGWKIRRGSLHNMDVDELETKGAQTGLVMELEDVKDAEKIQPNQIPSGLDRMAYTVDGFMTDVSGVSESQRGMDRADVAARAIEAKRAAGSVNLAKPMDNLLRTRHIVARNILNLIQTYYTEERVLQVSADHLGAEPEEIVINQTTPEGNVVNDLTLGEYSVVVSSVPTRESYMESQLDEALRMREIGLPIPDNFILENSTLAKKQEILQSMQDDGAAEMARRREELDLATAEAELAGKQAEAQRKAAETELAGARADKTQVDADIAAATAGDDGGQGEKNAVEKYRIDQEIALKRYELQEMLKLKRRELLLKQAIEEEKIEAGFRKEQADAVKPTEQAGAQQ